MQQLFAVAAPGLEPVVAAELCALGYDGVPAVGGVAFAAPWSALLSLNRRLGTASRILVRFARFKAVHLAELARASKRLPWVEVVAPGAVVRVRATCRRSKIYHSGAAAQRVLEGLAHVVPVTAAAPATDEEAASDGTDGVQEIVLRLENNQCEISLNSSGAHLHRRGFKVETAKAPLRETLGVALLRMCEWTPDEALVDPMCGSGTLPLEAATWAANLWPGRGRVFACEHWPVLRANGKVAAAAPGALLPPEQPRIFAYDRDAGAVAITTRNAARADLLPWMVVQHQALAHLQAPEGVRPGLVLCNPPWGERVGERRALRNLYATLGKVMQTTMAGWRLGLITSRPELAQASGLNFARVSEPLLHGGTRIRLYRT